MTWEPLAFMSVVIVVVYTVGFFLGMYYKQKAIDEENQKKLAKDKKGTKTRRR